MTEVTQTPFQEHKSEILETSIGTFINDPDKQKVYWQYKQCKTMVELIPHTAYALIHAAQEVKAAPTD
jgi:hypothetical protein